MIKNFFRIAYRNLLRQKAFSLINISGLAIGMASALLIILWIQQEVSYDNFYPKRDRLYQSWNRDRGGKGMNAWNVTPKPLGPALKATFPEIEKSTRVNWDETLLFTVGEKNLNVIGTMTDPDFLTMFDFPFLEGNPNTALNQPDGIVLNEKLSGQLFGHEEAMGKTIRLDNKYNFTVTGIMKNLPDNSQFDFNYILPWSFMKTSGQDDSSWNNNSTHNYVLLKPNITLASANKKIENIIIRHAEAGVTTKSFLYPVSKLHLYGQVENGELVEGKMKSVKVFALIAGFILLIACINFMNMSTARSEKRAKEVGIRKVVGAEKKWLIAQFLGESVLIACLAGLLALAITQGSLPSFNRLTSKNLTIGLDQLSFWIFFTGFILFTGVLAGTYPAFFLSSFKPIRVLKGSFKNSHAPVNPRKILVVLQFTCALTLIVCTIIIAQQVKYAQDRQSGYDKNNLIYIPLAGDMNKNYTLIRQELIRQGIATSVTKTSAPLTEGWSSGGAEWRGKDPNARVSFNFFNSDGGLVKTSGMTLVDGRDMDLAQFPTDSTAVLLNESAVKLMGFKNPLGEMLDYNGIHWHVIGVIKDFILQSPYDPISPMVISGPKADWFNVIHVKFNNTRSTADNLAATEKVFKTFNPKYPFESHFVDEQYAKKFSDEKTTGTLTALFAGLTIFISCLGLFGLATYMAQNRIKEIGVRKVLGASVTGIAGMLSKDFVWLVLIALCIASPVAWLAMHQWLAGYAYHVNISWFIFALAGGLGIVITILTVSYQSFRAAMANPIKSLRTE